MLPIVQIYAAPKIGYSLVASQPSISLIDVHPDAGSICQVESPLDSTRCRILPSRSDLRSAVASLHFHASRSRLPPFPLTNDKRESTKMRNRSISSTHSHSLALSRALVLRWIYAERSKRAVRFVCLCLPIYPITSNPPWCSLRPWRR